MNFIYVKYQSWIFYFINKYDSKFKIYILGIERLIKYMKISFLFIVKIILEK